MTSSVVKNAVRRLKGFWLVVRLSRLNPDQISDWLDSDEHHAELEALMPPDPFGANGDRPRWRKRHEQSPPSTELLPDDTDEYLVFLREQRALAATLIKPTHLSPPEGYESWLDFAVETFDTRQIWVNLTPIGMETPDRDAMREAARAELRELRLHVMDK